MSGNSEILTGEKYIFYKVDNEMYTGGSKIKGIYEDMDSSYHGLFIGQVVTLFGDEGITKNNEQLVSYVVAAEREGRETIYLEVYYGPSGPSIGGKYRDEYMEAAIELETIIKNVNPIDFSCKSKYGDVGVTINMGTKDGEGFYKTVLFSFMNCLLLLIAILVLLAIEKFWRIR